MGLMNSTTIQKTAGLEETVLWLGETPLRINCDLAIQLLSALELYALECFNKTAEHRKNVLALETIDEILRVFLRVITTFLGSHYGLLFLWRLDFSFSPSAWKGLPTIQHKLFPLLEFLVCS